MTGFAFFLGGRDLEMVEIAALVRGELGAAAVIDHRLPWHGAAASAYAAEIAAALAAGRQPVLVELRFDLAADVRARCRVIDHHGRRAGATKPTSLEQVFVLLRLPAARWTRRHALVAANDRGWIPELRAMGATPTEIAAIRLEDRAAQGIGEAEERAGEIALSERTQELGGSLTVVRLPHGHTAVITDRLAIEAGGGQPPEALILSPGEINFSGRGPRVRALARAFPGGWYGGALPDYGFWGCGAPVPTLRAVLEALS